ncbi:hypothetical protein CDD80_2530 [Ophiocordyceps camponoti-rufipedis]|uniref:Uncharacterized protein n=1 Tax=Ophiocordyceps camponoti-rufipedis TaxID=2004952 RepID=A0A2C5Z767_9HYPO|nr:hypothetical protein CDD80_2530 [Ophiocordyceps camponoti-rufipedis]
MNRYKHGSLPSDIDIGSEYQGVIKPQALRHGAAVDHGENMANIKSAEQWRLYSNLINDDSLDRYNGEMAGGKGFIAAEKAICHYSHVKALLPIHHGEPVMKAYGNAHDVPLFQSEVRARYAQNFSCATATTVTISRYCHAPKVRCRQHGSFRSGFGDAFAPDGGFGPSALPLRFCRDVPVFMDTIQPLREENKMVRTYCVREVEGRTVALECAGWKGRVVGRCVGRDFTQASGWFNFSARSYDHLPW